MTRKTICELALVCAVGAMLFGPGLWNRDLWHPLEPNYAQIAHEVVARGSWLPLHLNGEPYYRKIIYVQSSTKKLAAPNH